jgi:Holliday junction resolvase RusA-like endonuclease
VAVLLYHHNMPILPNIISINGRDVHSSKNSHRIVGKRLIKSKAAMADESIFAAQLYEQRETWERMCKRHALPLVLMIRLRRETKRKFDYNNLLQGLLDAMTAAGYLADDDMKNVIPIPVPWVHDKSNPGADIWLASWGDYQRFLEAGYGTK